jgi:mono/diheme cytochrome c family protein
VHVSGYLSAAAALLAATASLAADQVGVPAAPAAKGVYTAAQAERGRNEYTTACAHCHSSDLLGDPRLEVPSLAEDDFFVRWSGRTVGELFHMISTDMPADRPGRLAKSAYADIVAYILRVNRFPEGMKELGADVTAMNDIVIEKQP